MLLSTVTTALSALAAISTYSSSDGFERDPDQDTLFSGWMDGLSRFIIIALPIL